MYSNVDISHVQYVYCVSIKCSVLGMIIMLLDCVGWLDNAGSFDRLIPLMCPGENSLSYIFIEVLSHYSLSSRAQQTSM